MADDRQLPPRSDPAESRGTRTRGKQTIRRLLNAGREALLEIGFGDLRVDDVSNRAGTSHGTFYLYFSDKADLLRALQEDLLHVIDEFGHTLPVLDANPETRGQLEAWIRELLRQLHPYEGVLRALMAADPAWDWHELTGTIETAFTQRIKAANGANLDVAPEQLAWAVSAMLVGLMTGAPTSPAGHAAFARMLHRGTVLSTD